MKQENASGENTSSPITRRAALTATAGGLVSSMVSTQVTAQRSNRLLWETEIGGDVYSSPTVIDGSVFIGSQGDTGLHTLDVQNGEQQWIIDNGYNVKSSPAVAGGKVFFGDNNTSLNLAFDVDTGRYDWLHQTETGVESSPTVVNGTVFIGNNDGNLYALNAGNGEEQWAFTTGGFVRSSPTVVDGTVFVGSDDNNLYAVDAESGTQLWAFDTGQSVNSSPTVMHGTVFVGSDDDNLYAVDAETGEEEWALETGGNVKSSPTVVDGTVFVGSNEGTLYALDAGTGTQQWTLETEGGLESSPTVADGTVFVGSIDNNLYAVDAESGEQEWTFETGGAVYSSPTVVDGRVFVGSDDGNLYAIDAGVDGSSEGTRVMLGTLGYHGDWKYASWLRNDIEILGRDVASGGEMLVAGSVGIGGGYAALRWRSDQKANTQDPMESETKQAINSEQSDVDKPEDEETETGERENIPDAIEDMSGVRRSNADALRAAGYDTINDIHRASRNELSEIDGIGKALAGRIKAKIGDTDSNTTLVPNNGEVKSETLKHAAENALETAITAKSNGDLSGAVSAYNDAISEYQSVLEAVDGGDTGERKRLQDKIKKIRSDLEATKTRRKQHKEIIEALQPAERSFQEAIVAYIEDDRTVARIRFRQARDTFEDAHEIITESEDDLLTEQLEVSIQPDRELSSMTLADLSLIPETIIKELADAGIETVGDLETGHESPWTPATVEQLVTDDTIDEDIVTALTLLSWWHGDVIYMFDTAEAIERRQQQADYGFNRSS